MSQVVCAIGRQGPEGVQLLGTGFAVSTTRIATAFHVVGPSDENLVVALPRYQNLSQYQDTSDRQLRAVSARMAAPDPVRDLCILEVEQYRMSFPYSLDGTDSVPPGTPVVTWGFPHANSGRLVLTQQQAHVGARILIESAGAKSKHIVLNTQAREGQSGGPVLDPSSNSVVAVLIGSYAPGGGGGISLGGVDPATLHQTTHAISAEYLREML
ncbi:S1 family peptidase [Ornithinimicrobium flavum]|uniref:S1 family peptidase n=1 Tax=Ornithinimicrobium flavum TaxID=1288636 RepID=UPI001930F5F5|nr:serine protease [Ornithinimicrobium flavum]